MRPSGTPSMMPNPFLINGCCGRVYSFPLHSFWAEPSDILTKPLHCNIAWPFVEPLLFWKGDTLEAIVFSKWMRFPAMLMTSSFSSLSSTFKSSSLKHKVFNIFQNHVIPLIVWIVSYFWLQTNSIQYVYIFLCICQRQECPWWASCYPLRDWKKRDARLPWMSGMRTRRETITTLLGFLYGTHAHGEHPVRDTHGEHSIRILIQYTNWSVSDVFKCVHQCACLPTFGESMPSWSTCWLDYTLTLWERYHIDGNHLVFLLNTLLTLMF